MITFEYDACATVINTKWKLFQKMNTNGPTSGAMFKEWTSSKQVWFCYVASSSSVLSGSVHCQKSITSDTISQRSWANISSLLYAFRWLEQRTSKWIYQNDALYGYMQKKCIAKYCKNTLTIPIQWYWRRLNTPKQTIQFSSSSSMRLGEVLLRPFGFKVSLMSIAHLNTADCHLLWKGRVQVHSTIPVFFRNLMQSYSEVNDVIRASMKLLTIELRNASE